MTNHPNRSVAVTKMSVEFDIRPLEAGELPYAHEVAEALDAMANYIAEHGYIDGNSYHADYRFRARGHVKFTVNYR